MQSIPQLMEILTDRGARGLPLERVYRHVCREDLLLQCYSQIGTNAGAMTRGVTDETVDGMSLAKIHQIAQILRDGDWEWKPVRRVLIPKKSGKLRPLGLPTWSDKLVQQAVKVLLEAYYEPQFSNRSFGFRRGLGCHDALADIARWAGVTWFIEGDISKCFDNIDHDVLMSLLGEQIHDDRLLKLMRTMLQAGYMEDWKRYPTLSGTPQGGVASPLLANIYLDRLDRFVETELLPQYNRGESRRKNLEWVKVNNLINHHRTTLPADEYQALVQRRRTMSSYDTADPNFRRLTYVRYADDFLLGFTGPKDEAEQIKARLKQFVESKLNLQLSDEKTLITHAKTEKARFLGYEVQVMRSDSKVDHNGRRSVNGLISMLVPRDVIESHGKAYMSHGKPTQRDDLLHKSDHEIVSHYQTVYRGLVNYYGMAHNLSTRLNQLRWVLETSMVCTLAGKHRCSCASLWRKHKVKLPTPCGWVNAFEVRSVGNDKRTKVTHFGGISLRRRKFSPVGERKAGNGIPGSLHLRERILGTVCQVCRKSDGNLQIHRIRRMADILGGNPQDRPHWQQVMLAMNRLTITVCGECHDGIHSRCERPPLS